MQATHRPHSYQITNKITGQVVKFLPRNQHSGDMLEMETLYVPFSAEPPLHYHPYQEEQLKVLKGELTVRLNDEVKIYREGAIITIKRNARHSMWNSGFTTTLVSWKVTPAMDTVRFLRTMTALSNIGAVNEKGIPALPLMVFLLVKYKRTFRLDKPHGWVIHLLYILFIPVFFVLDYNKRFNNPDHF